MWATEENVKWVLAAFVLVLVVSYAGYHLGKQIYNYWKNVPGLGDEEKPTIIECKEKIAKVVEPMPEDKFNNYILFKKSRNEWIENSEAKEIGFCLDKECSKDNLYRMMNILFVKEKGITKTDGYFYSIDGNNEKLIGKIVKARVGLIDKGFFKSIFDDKQIKKLESSYYNKLYLCTI